MRIEAGVVGDEADMLAAKRRELLRFENVDAGLHPRGVTRVFRCRMRRRGSQREKRYKDGEMDECKLPALESSQRVPRY